MDARDREILKSLVDKRARERSKTAFSADPEALTKEAIEAEEMGIPDLARALRNFRDKVVNPLLGEGWTVERIEQAALNHFRRYS